MALLLIAAWLTLCVCAGILFITWKSWKWTGDSVDAGRPSDATPVTNEPVIIELTAGVVFSPASPPSRLYAEEVIPVTRGMQPLAVDVSEEILTTYSAEGMPPAELTAKVADPSHAQLSRMEVHHPLGISALEDVVSLNRGDRIRAGFDIDKSVMEHVPPPPPGYPSVPSCVSVKIVLTLRGYATVEQ